MSKLRPIPIPFRQRWQDFRTRVLPLLTCGVTLVGVGYLWKREALPTSTMGEVEAYVSEVPSPGAGLLTNVIVDRFDNVEAGQVIGTIIVNRPEFLQSSLAVVQAEIELIRLDMLQGQQRNALELATLELSWLDKRADLAIHKLALQQAERDYRRVSQLFERNMVSEEEYDLARNLKLTLEETVAQTEGLVAAMEQSIDELHRSQDAAFGADALQATLDLKREQLQQVEAELKPVDLIAPISGTVTTVYRREGEYVIEGEPIVSIQSPRTERIIAYLRPPLTLEPTVGMDVEISVRNSTRQRVPSQIVSIGPRIEPLPIESAFRHPLVYQFESGLPIAVGIPSDLKLRPGEVVDVILQP